ncbi:hypothetical protein E2C01_081316 [Portunus trituberculatus]|uniref:Uncharacterized protein n=1 Tax=Portunus trituberculatus TaxID=210409 RepID=A0A5B7IXN0_PORTR|nr:hypothetical protein [Portunus trituberculatus]
MSFCHPELRYLHPGSNSSHENRHTKETLLPTLRKVIGECAGVPTGVNTPSVVALGASKPIPLLQTEAAAVAVMVVVVVVLGFLVTYAVVLLNVVDTKTSPEAPL